MSQEERNQNDRIRELITENGELKLELDRCRGSLSNSQNEVKRLTKENQAIREEMLLLQKRLELMTDSKTANHDFDALEKRVSQIEELLELKFPGMTE